MKLSGLILFLVFALFFVFNVEAADLGHDCFQLCSKYFTGVANSNCLNLCVKQLTEAGAGKR